MLAPLAQTLQREGRTFTFLAMTTAGAYLDRRGIPHIGYRELKGAQDEDVQAYGELLLHDLPVEGPVSREESVAYLGLNYRELVRDHGADKAQDLYKNLGRQAFLPVSLFERVFEDLLPSLVVATNSPRSEQAALLAASKQGIPSICAVDLFGLQEVQWISKPKYANRICVLNEDVRQMFIEYGRKPEEVVVTGNPAFDRLTDDQIVSAAAKLRQDRCWDDGLVSILWASQIESAQHPFTDRTGDPSLPRRIESYLRNFVASDKRFRLIVRYHPSESEIFRPQERVEFSPQEEDVSILLNAVDLVVVTASTVGLEASLTGRPVISVDCSVFTPDSPYSLMGISTGVSCVDDLGQVLRELCESNQINRQQETRKLPFPEKANATDKLMKVVDSLVDLSK